MRKDLGIAVGKEDVATCFAHKAYDKVSIAKNWDVTGKAPIGCRWTDINKGDDENPEYRSRLVAEEMTRSPSAE